MSKIALITGANKGIGFETARQLAQKGIHVFLAARDRAKGEAAARALAETELPVEFLQLDVTNCDSIAAAVSAVEEKHSSLDILINNAGIGRDDPDKKPSEQTLEVWRETFETNLYGLIAVTRAFLPLLRRSPAGRIVNVSSILGSMALHSDPNSPIYDSKRVAYNVSKSAVNAWTVQLAYELKNTPIKVNAGHPGWVKTELGGEEAPLSVEEGAATSVYLAMLDKDGPSGTYVFGRDVLPW